MVNRLRSNREVKEDVTNKRMLYVKSLFLLFLVNLGADFPCLVVVQPFEIRAQVVLGTAAKLHVNALRGCDMQQVRSGQAIFRVKCGPELKVQMRQRKNPAS